MSHHGVISLAQLRQADIHEAQLQELLAQGRLRRVARGWYATPLALPDAVRAVSLRARLGCLSGCRAHGLWVPEFDGLHVIINPGAPVVTGPGIHCHRLKTVCHDAVAPVLDCVAHTIQRHDAETGLIVLESAIDKGHVSLAEATTLFHEAPKRKLGTLALFTQGPQSGSETRVRLFLQRRNIPVRPQVLIPGVGRVDLLVGKSLIVECDSAAHHSRPRDHEEDRRRDLAALGLGYRTIRLSYSQIWHSWEQTRGVLAAELATRRHLRPPIPRAA